MSGLGNVIKNAKNSVKGSFSEGAQQIAKGDIIGGVATILNGPGDALSNLTGGAALGDSMKGMQSRSDALQNWCWYCITPKLENQTAKGFSSFLPFLGNVSSSVTLPWYYVQTANMPLREFAADSTNMNGHPVHFPESYSVGQLQLGLFLDSSNKAYEWLTTWQSFIMGSKDPKVADNQGAWNVPAQYKKDINIVLLNVSKKKMLNVKYINCWPAAPEALSLTSSNAEALVQNVSFYVEDVEVKVFNDKGFLGNLKESAVGFAMGALQGGINKGLSSLLG